jgi:hypothetical protein
MSKKQINEKTLEMLFNRYFMQAFRFGEISLFAPTNAEERREGYDARFFNENQKPFREILLQFKAPEIQKQKFKIKCTPEQHNKLCKKYFSDAFYVVPTFKSIQDLNLKQQEVRNSLEFLSFFICIKITKDLPKEIDSFSYQKTSEGNKIPGFHYKKRFKNRKLSKDFLVKPRSLLLRGDQLVKKYKQKKIGVKLDPFVIGQADLEFSTGEAKLERTAENQVSIFKNDVLQLSEAQADQFAEGMKNEHYSSTFRSYDNK